MQRRTGNKRVTISLSTEAIAKIAAILSEAALEYGKRGKPKECAYLHEAAAAYYHAYNRESR